MLKIGVISDSHHRSDIAKSAIDYLKEKSVDLLLHAGDIVEISTLKDMRDSGIPYKAVLGNNDSFLKSCESEFEIYPEPYDFEFKNLKIRLMHHPFYFENSANLTIYGHTHFFAGVLNGANLTLNSGEICARKKPKHEFAYIEFENSKFRVFKVEKDFGEKFWNQREIIL